VDFLGDVKAVTGDVGEVADDALVLFDIGGLSGGWVKQCRVGGSEGTIDIVHAKFVECLDDVIGQVEGDGAIVMTCDLGTSVLGADIIPCQGTISLL
jgi:hypothetical protein